MDNPFSWHYLTTRPGENEAFGPFAILFLVFFSAGFLISMIVYNGAARRIFPNPVIHRMARRWAAYSTTIFGFGLFFFAVRALQITLLTFEMRIWMWLSILAVFLFAAYVVYDYARGYTPAIREFEEQKRKNQYIRPNAAGATAFPVAARPVRRRRR
jgi:hypothetical protein